MSDIMFDGCLISKGAIAGGTIGLAISFWLVLSSFNLNIRPPTLPPTSIDGCYDARNYSIANNFSASPWSPYIYGDADHLYDTVTMSSAIFTDSVNATNLRTQKFGDTRPVSSIQNYVRPTCRVKLTLCFIQQNIQDNKPEYLFDN
jgi:hypothetical protein